MMFRFLIGKVRSWSNWWSYCWGIDDWGERNTIALEVSIIIIFTLLGIGVIGFFIRCALYGG